MLQQLADDFLAIQPALDVLPDGQAHRIEAEITLSLEVKQNGFALKLPDGTNENPWVTAARTPGSQRIEILREEGPPEVVVDNSSEIKEYPGGGCSAAGGAGGFGLLLVAAGSVLARRRRR